MNCVCVLVYFVCVKSYECTASVVVVVVIFRLLVCELIRVVCKMFIAIDERVREGERETHMWSERRTLTKCEKVNGTNVLRIKRKDSVKYSDERDRIALNRKQKRPNWCGSSATITIECRKIADAKAGRQS